MAVVAAQAAVQAADLDLGAVKPYRVGIAMGTSVGGLVRGETFHRQLLTRGYARTNPALLRTYPLYSASDAVSHHLGIKGPKFVVSNACAAGANAIGLALDLLRSRQVDVVLAGGVDPLDILSLAGFNSLQAVDPRPCAPYSRSSGINIGEGAAWLVLEPEERARARSAPILAYLLGYGLSADAYHPTAPDPAGSGALRSMERAIRRAGLTVDAIDYINGHGTGTAANDDAEPRAVVTLFKNRAREVPISSTKSQIGHTLGAAGAIEAAICVLALRDQVLPPTVNFDPDAARYDLDFVPGAARPARVENVLSNSFAFGGNNCSLVFGRKAVRSQPALDTPVVITGVGVVSPLGVGYRAFLEAVREGRLGLRPVEIPELAPCRGRLAGEVRDPSYRRLVDPAYARRLDQIGLLAVASARMACQDAGLRVQPSNADRIGVIFATGTGPMETVEAVSRTIILEGPHRVNPRLFPNTVMNAAAGHVCISLQIKGPTSTLATGCVAGLQAIWYAGELIRNGEADAVLVVGADEYTPVLHIGYDRLRALTDTAVRPYDRNRSGTALAAAGVALVLESAAHAVTRGAPIRGQVLGFGAAADAGPLLHNDPAGTAWAECFRICLDNAGVLPGDVGCVFGAARGARQVDQGEARALAEVFGRDRPPRLANLTGQVGYAQSTAALLSLVVALETMATGWVPPVMGLEEPLPEVEPLLRSPAEAAGKPCLISAGAWGGTYAAVLAGPWGA
ncbi:MAG: beta-ketoacyl-[acyl-carrier-protein] synthase family protein [Bacillota bacterium]